ncbi:MAG TPA: mannose-1-phosphate guanylyltransferase [Leeuwenhoekiella sp.]|nr:mannose-1-phosphate guanylyltransferase [Leeuwenhoekiella sp.]
MAGGVGSRFWPLSTAHLPKQFHDILGAGQTLIQKTFSRLSKAVPEGNILILTNERYKRLVNEQLPQVEDLNIVLEPAMRNTAPCILMAALKIFKNNPNATMVVAPSDHWIEDEDAFTNDLNLAFEASIADKAENIADDILVTLGIAPTFPHTGYGYISYIKNDQKVKKVSAFTEKPDYVTAKKFITEGNYVWNAGIFIWKAKTIIDAFQKYLPEMHRILSGGIPVYNTNHEQTFVNEEYEKVENISIDYGILEKSQNVGVVPATFDWSDMGAWGSLYDKQQKDAEDNVIINAKVISKNSSGNLIHSREGKIVVLHGLHDFVVVDKDDILLIMEKKKEQEVKILRQEVKEIFGEDLV